MLLERLKLHTRFPTLTVLMLRLQKDMKHPLLQHRKKKKGKKRNALAFGSPSWFSTKAQHVKPPPAPQSTRKSNIQVFLQ